MNMNKLLFLSYFLLFGAIRSFAQLPDSTIAPNWQAYDVDIQLHNMYSYLNQGKAVILNFATTWSPHSYSYATGNALQTFYTNRGPNATVPQAQVFLIESDPNTDYTCLTGASTVCGSAGSVGNFVAGINYPILDQGTISIAKNYLADRRFPSVYMVCPNKTLFYIGQKTAEQLDTLLLERCGITPGAQTQPLNLVTNITNNLCFGDIKGKIVIQVSGGSIPYTYKWSNNVATNTTTLANNLAAGSYSVTVTDKYHQTVIKNVIVTEPSQLSTNPIITDYQKCGVKGTIQLNATGGISPYSFNWSSVGISTQGEISNLVSANTFTVTITDANSCSAVKSNLGVKAYENMPTTSISSPTTPLSCTQQSIIMSPTVLPSSGNYSYNWYNITNNNNNSIGQGLSFPISEAGSYKVVVTDINSRCESFATFSVNALGATVPPIVIQGPPNNKLTCYTAGVALTTTANNSICTDCQYQWSVPSGSTNPGNNFSATGIVSGTYSVTATRGGCSTSASIVLTQDLSVPTIATVNNLAIKCNAPDITINPQVSPVNTTFNWQGIGIVGSNNTPTIKANIAGAYSLTITNTNNGCTRVGSFSVANQVVTPIVTLTETALGNCSKKITASVNSGGVPVESSYAWSAGNSSLNNITVSQSGNYVVTFTNVITGCSETKSISVTVTGLGVALTAAAGNFCHGVSRIISSQITNNSSGTLTYQWSSNINGISGAINSSTASATKNGIYTLSVTSSNGCVGIGSITITDFGTIPSITAGADISICSGGIQTITTTTTGGTAPYTYQWSPNTAISNTTDSEITIVGLTNTTTYTVLVTDTKGCFSTASKKITVNSLPVISNLNSTYTSCSVLNPTVTNAGTSPQYSWTSGEGFPVTNQKNVSITTGGTYTFNVISSLTGCSSSYTLFVNVPTLTVSIGTPTTVGVGICPKYEAFPSGGTSPYTYLWSSTNTPPFSATTKVITATTSSTFLVTVTGNNGCKATAQRVIVPPVNCAGANSLVNSLNQWSDINSNTALLKVNPNPTSSAVNIWFYTPIKKDAFFEIFDYAGKKILSQHETEEKKHFDAQFDLSSFPNGVYLIKATSGEDILTERVIKQ